MIGIDILSAMRLISFNASWLKAIAISDWIARTLSDYSLSSKLRVAKNQNGLNLKKNNDFNF